MSRREGEVLCGVEGGEERGDGSEAMGFQCMYLDSKMIPRDEINHMKNYKVEYNSSGIYGIAANSPLLCRLFFLFFCWIEGGNLVRVCARIFFLLLKSYPLLKAI